MIRSIEYEGMSSVKESDILKELRDQKVGLSVESPYDPSRVKRAQLIIGELLATKGRIGATVELITEAIPPNAISIIFDIDEGPKIKIEEIEIIGNEMFSDRRIKRVMKLLKETGPITAIKSQDVYHPIKMTDDITRIRMLYAENGYVRANILEPKVEVRSQSIYRTLPFIKPPMPWGIPLPFLKKKTDRFYITIEIEENDQYRIGEVGITGNEEFTDDQIRFVLGLIPGKVYNETLLRDGFENLKKLYGRVGYINFTPVPIHDFNDQDKIVNLTINVEEDRKFYVNRIQFRGNTTTRDKVVRREIMIDEGDSFDSTLWDISLLRLNQLGYFEEIKDEDAEIKSDPTKPEVDITLNVKEKGRNQIGFSGGVSGIGGSFLGLSYSTNNFLGFGETLSVELQGGTRASNYVFSFTEPYLLDRPISTGVSVFSSNYRFDQARDSFGLDPSKLPAGFGFENRLNYDQKRMGFNVFTSYPMKVFHRMGLNYEWSNSETDAVNPATRDFFQNVRTREQEQFISGSSGSFTNFRSRTITPTYTWNTVNNPMNPSSGQRLTASTEYTGGILGGNVSFYRPTFDYQFFRPMNRFRNTLAVRLNGAYIRGFSGLSVPFFERFFMGATSISAGTTSFLSARFPG